MRRVALAALTAVAVLASGAAAAQSATTAAPAVVVATLDTGTNPFHPCFRRPGLEHPQQVAPSYPASSQPLPLTLADTYQKSLDASAATLQSIRPNTLYHVPGTNLSFYGGAGAATEFVDDDPNGGHGAQASSQIACGGSFGMAPDAQLVVLNGYDDNSPTNVGQMLRWVGAQPWIDVVHLNIQDLPGVLPWEEITALNETGKFVVIAAGNGVNGKSVAYPMELSSYNAPPGSLIAGANDNDGYTYYSNYNPHVVMDGVNTRAASGTSFDSTTFGGTSSASPRITGYVARVLADTRSRFGHTGEGLVTIPAGNPRPSTGPLSDGRLTSPELHEVVRKTADPNSHASKYDGGSGTATPNQPIPQPTPLPFAFYPKMGYGEVSEVTLPNALAVLAGDAPMPARPYEDRFYEASETLRNSGV
jgi:hypothetical protein